MKYLLDTNVWIHYLRRKGDRLVKARFLAQQPIDIMLCSIVVSEIYYGAESSNDPVNQCLAVEQLLRPYVSLKYGDVEAKMYARIRTTLEQRGHSDWPL